MTGWIKIHREITSHWIFQDAEKFKWWVDMLFLASYEDNRTLVKNQVAEVKRGQLIGSLSFFMKRWGVGKERVSNFLKLLQSHRMIDKKSDKNITIITICNYESYQDVSDNLPDNLSDYNADNLPDNLPDTTKEGKEVKEINNNNSNARTREERLVWDETRERGFGEAFKCGGQIMALARNNRLTAGEIKEYLERYMNDRQVMNLGHQDISHFGTAFKNYVEKEMRKPKSDSQPKPQKKIITNEDLYKEMYG